MNKLQLRLLGFFSLSEFVIRLMQYKSSLEKKWLIFPMVRKKRKSQHLKHSPFPCHKIPGWIFSSHQTVLAHSSWRWVSTGDVTRSAQGYICKRAVPSNAPFPLQMEKAFLFSVWGHLFSYLLYFWTPMLLVCVLGLRFISSMRRM